jgi:hypothetical protein
MYKMVKMEVHFFMNMNGDIRENYFQDFFNSAHFYH